MSHNSSRIRIGTIDIDALTFAEALDRIEELVIARRGGMVFTPNVDHIVNAENNVAFRQAYHRADLSLVDGQPVLWAARILGQTLPEKVSGSDLVLPLLIRAAARSWRVYLLGAEPGVAEKVAEWLQTTHEVNIVGTAAPRVDLENPLENQKIAANIRAVKPDLVLVALGSPKQELFIHQIAKSLEPAVFLGVGASLDFLAGTVQRSPAWMSRAGLEWLYRLVREPRRLWRRYLVNDVQFFGILYRDMMRAHKRTKVR